MTTLISQVGCGQRRRCDARCYNAQHTRCQCICGGRNHGVGLKQALANTREFVAETVAQKGLVELFCEGESILPIVKDLKEREATCSEQ